MASGPLPGWVSIFCNSFTLAPILLADAGFPASAAGVAGACAGAPDCAAAGNASTNAARVQQRARMCAAQTNGRRKWVGIMAELSSMPGEIENAWRAVAVASRPGPATQKFKI